MKKLMHRCFGLVPLIVIGVVNAGQPLHRVVQLRTVEVSRCEAVTEYNVAEVSSFVRKRPRSTALGSVPSQVADSLQGFLVGGIVKRQRDVVFTRMERRDPIDKSQWTGADRATARLFFVSTSHPDACEAFVRGKRVNVVLSQRAECDTYPPTGACLFDLPIRLVDSETWAKYGE